MAAPRTRDIEDAIPYSKDAPYRGMPDKTGRLPYLSLRAEERGVAISACRFVRTR